MTPRNAIAAITRLALFLLLAAASWPAHPAAATADDLARRFAAPPDDARPWVYWFWMNGNITREGITADLEAMRRVGIGGVLIMHTSAAPTGGTGIPPGPVQFMSPEWRGLFSFALREADRLGLKVIMNNDDGFTGSGGPWNTVERSMQVVTTSTTRVTGPRQFDGQLPQPVAALGHYRDIAVLAFPTPTDSTVDLRSHAPKITSSDVQCAVSQLADGDLSTAGGLPTFRHGRPQWIQLDLAEPVRAGSLTLHMEAGRHNYRADLLASDDGKTFQRIASRDVRHLFVMPTPLVFDFEPRMARFFRVLFTASTRVAVPMGIREIEIHGTGRIADWPAKAARVRADVPDPADAPTIPASIPLDRIVDLTSRLDADGRLRWDVPDGDWTLLRLGHTTNGKQNHPCSPGGAGLECDKLSRPAIETHFNAFLAKLLADAGPLAGKTLIGTHVDSWEIDTQTWTPGLREEFARRRGYDPLAYLPVLAGHAVGGAAVAERFLWDYRRTLADMIADNYFGHLRSLAHDHGLDLSVEAYGNGNFDNLQCASRADLPMAEFWVDSRQGTWLAYAKQAASVAHTCGGRVVPAEAFTATEGAGKWQNHPYKLKAIGDRMFAAGVNRFVIHRYAMQPWLDRRPGMTFGRWGVHFERTTTWFEQSRAWLTYLARCQYLLQQGVPVVDLCYFVGEGAPNGLPPAGELASKPPAGYDYDGCHDEVMLGRMSVNDGRLALPEGTSYRLLVLPKSRCMTPEMLRRLRDLVRQGARVIGPKPERSPSLVDYPRCDADVHRLADELWGDALVPGEKVTGKGRVYWGRSLDDVLGSIGVFPDVELDGGAAQTTAWIHRRVAGAEVYFLSNQGDDPQSVRVTFRVEGRMPEFWHPDTGQIEPAGQWQQTDDQRTAVHVSLDPRGSVFVVFRRDAKAADPVVAVSRGGESVASPTPAAEVRILDERPYMAASRGGRYELKTASGRRWVCDVPEVPTPLMLDGPWELSFPPEGGDPPSVKLDTLVSWSRHRDPGVKYFSGTAVYRKTFDVAAERLGRCKELWLDLGRVAEIAEVSLNGCDLGILWKQPFRVSIAEVARPGANRLEVRVTNLWPNRLIGDERKPAYLKWTPAGAPAEWPEWLVSGGPVPPTGRSTFATWHFYEKNSPLLDSGLLGPVKLQSRVVVPAHH